MTDRRRLVNVLIMRILLVAVVLSLITTGIVAAVYYYEERDRLSSRLSEIEHTHIDALAGALWTLDLNLIEAHLAGIEQIEGVRSAWIEDAHGPYAGRRPSAYDSVVKHQIEYRHSGESRVLGTLFLVPDTSALVASVRSRSLFALAMQIGTVIMVSFVSYLVLHFSAIRHILMIAGYMRRYGPDRETSELVLSRSPAFSPAGGDELDELTAAINDLRRRLNRAYENLSRELELRRTAESELKVAYSESQDHVRQQTEELRLANRLLSSQVSELQETRDRLKVARDEEADLSRAKTEFLATLGHEVRTPIAGIIGVVRLLTNRDDTDSIRSYLEMILSSAVDLHRIVDDIVEYSRYENEDPVLKRAPFSIRDAVRDSAELYEYQASANQSVISVSVSPDLPDAVVGDGERLRQILRNLINNAVKFTRGGEVKVVAFAQHRGETVLRIEFRVEDTGVGIPKDKMERLFSPYYQVEGTDHTHGSGLGLAISKQLAEYMDGSIVAESEPGKGSVFIVVLPFGLPGTDSTVTRTETGAGDAKHPGRTILVAEDNGINRYYLRELLSALGYRILEAADGKQAVEVALSEHPDLILMDVEMPEVDGIEATQRIRGQELGPATPIVALSAHEVTDLSERVAGVGIDAVLGKPIDEQRLFDTVDDLISRRTAKPGRPGKSSNHPVDTPPKT